MKKDLLFCVVEVKLRRKATKIRRVRPAQPPFFCLENENPSGVSERTHAKANAWTGRWHPSGGIISHKTSLARGFFNFFADLAGRPIRAEKDPVHSEE